MHLRDLDDDYSIAEKIVAIATNYNFDYTKETVIIYHYSSTIIHDAINSIFKEANWAKTIIKQYSSAGNESEQPIYKILNPFGDAIRKNQAIEFLLQKLWNFCVGDIILESKLNLLYAIMEEDELPEDTELFDFQAVYKLCN